MSLIRYPPLPVREEWAPSYLKARPGAVNRDFAFRLSDAQGMYPRPPGCHGAVDWFAPAGTEVSSPGAGVVTRTVATSDSSGPVFGGIVEVTEATGLVWVMRHVQPVAPLGAQVKPGEVVARVARWDDGGEHLHLEIWRSKAGGYNIGNMLDPHEVEWDAKTAVIVQPPPPARFYFEERPAPAGRGPVVHGGTTPERAGVLAKRMARAGKLVSTVAAEHGLTYVLEWEPGTHGDRFRWGPWGTDADRDTVQTQRELVQGRGMRAFAGRDSSLYPWPKEG
jgi:murein DD-endopeptidase MepM/ murein hydrolase activator NlpD